VTVPSHAAARPPAGPGRRGGGRAAELLRLPSQWTQIRGSGRKKEEGGGLKELSLVRPPSATQPRPQTPAAAAPLRAPTRRPRRAPLQLRPCSKPPFRGFYCLFWLVLDEVEGGLRTDGLLRNDLPETTQNVTKASLNSLTKKSCAAGISAAGFRHTPG
jgi:hypothetical protein